MILQALSPRILNRHEAETGPVRAIHPGRINRESQTLFALKTIALG